MTTDQPSRPLETIGADHPPRLERPTPAVAAAPARPPRRAAEDLRVLVVAPTPFFGDRGCHIRIYEEVRGLTRLGAEVVVVTYATGQDLPDVEIVRARPVPGIRARALGPSVGRPLLDLSLLASARRVVTSLRPHLVHAHLHEGIAIGALLRRRHRVPLVADLQGSLTAELVDHGFIASGGLVSRAARRVENWLVRQPDLVLISSAAAVSLLTTQGVEAARVAALPDGVDLAAFRPQPPDPALQAELGLGGKRIVVFLGVLTRYQGVDLLLEAAQRVARACPDAHFLVMGYPNASHYRDQARRLGLDRIVTLPGRIAYGQAARWLCLGEVAVSAKQSATEANGKLLNYMACGLPVVATDTPINRELLGDAGRFAAVGDPGALADRILELLADASGRRAAGAALRRRAEQQFSWTVLSERLAGCYTQLLDGTPASGR